MKNQLSDIEKELKKRWDFPYRWPGKQNDLWDRQTNFIYHTRSWEDLTAKLKTLETGRNEDSLFQYASIRWYNFWSSVAAELIFSEFDCVKIVKNKKDREKDFFLYSIPFDHKTTVFPGNFRKSYVYARENPLELIRWLYQNQSSQGRQHFKNRLYLVVYDKNGKHWKLKAEIGLLRSAITNYILNFDPEQLHSVTFTGNQKALSDIIWFSNELYRK